MTSGEGKIEYLRGKRDAMARSYAIQNVERYAVIMVSWMHCENFARKNSVVCTRKFFFHERRMEIVKEIPCPDHCINSVCSDHGIS